MGQIVLTRYYVYNVYSDDQDLRIHAFVEDPETFSKSEFEPAVMEFSGVFVEAEDSRHAEQIYLKPGPDDTFVSCEEPIATVQAREEWLEKIKQSLNGLRDVIEKDEERLRLQILIAKVVADLNKIADTSSDIVRCLRRIYPNGKASNQELFDGLVEKYAEQLRSLKYRSRSKNKESGSNDDQADLI